MKFGLEHPASRETVAWPGISRISLSLAGPPRALVPLRYAYFA